MCRTALTVSGPGFQARHDAGPGRQTINDFEPSVLGTVPKFHGPLLQSPALDRPYLALTAVIALDGGLRDQQCGVQHRDSDPELHLLPEIDTRRRVVALDVDTPFLGNAITLQADAHHSACERLLRA